MYQSIIYTQSNNIVDLLFHRRNLILDLVLGDWQNQLLIDLAPSPLTKNIAGV